MMLMTKSRLNTQKLNAGKLPRSLTNSTDSQQSNHQHHSFNYPPDLRTANEMIAQSKNPGGSPRIINITDFTQQECTCGDDDHDHDR